MTLMNLFTNFFLFFFFSLSLSSEQNIIGTRHINVFGKQIFVDNSPFFVKGICYSPAQIGDNPVYEHPYGDYYTKEYHHIWERDFPLIKAMGANTIRVYGWDIHGVHFEFLDFAHKNGLMVIVTYYLGTAAEHPVSRTGERHMLLMDFLYQVKLYAGHPALLGWAFGNELNGDWNHFLQAFSDANNCNWNANLFPNDPNGCYYNPGGSCGAAIDCVYRNFFGWLDNVAWEAHNVMNQAARDAGRGYYNHLVFTSLADTDLLTNRFQAFEHYAPNLDLWAVHLYRGDNFGVGDFDFLAQFERSSQKPLLVTEFGVDAYRDPCGYSDDTPCYNTVDDPPVTFGEDQETQATYAVKLAGLLLNHSSATGKGSVAGGCIMSWIDEWWKAAVNVKGCHPTFPDPNFQPHDCEWKAHVDCPAQNVTKQGLCGYFLGSAPDHYVNEAWFGIMAVANEGGIVDKLFPRQIYVQMQTLWKGPAPSAWVSFSIGLLLLILVLVTLVLGIAFCLRARRQQQKLNQNHDGADSTHRGNHNHAASRGRRGGARTHVLHKIPPEKPTESTPLLV